MKEVDPRNALHALIEEALEEIGERNLSTDIAPSRKLPSLLEQCREMLEESSQARPEIRLINHFACTGGTLISKCIAALPNVYFFSEIEPRSSIGIVPDKPKFAPSDLIRHLKNSLRSVPDSLLDAVFLAGIREIYDWSRAEGADLVFRAHAHSVYCVEERPERTLISLLSEHYPVRSLITVRHPLESYASVLDKGWLRYEPQGIDAYARRYHDFLDEACSDAPIRYEDFVNDPEAVLSEICERLNLRYEPMVVDTFGLFNLTGDSGRSGEVIAPRPVRDFPSSLLDDAKGSRAFTDLIDRLGYRSRS